MQILNDYVYKYIQITNINDININEYISIDNINFILFNNNSYNHNIKDSTNNFYISKLSIYRSSINSLLKGSASTNINIFNMSIFIE